MNGRALHDWLAENRPAIACSLDYCVTEDEVRRLLNYHTGLDIPLDHEQEEAYRRYLLAFERQACTEC